MKLICGWLLAIPMLLAAEPTKEEANKTELKKWEGTWKVAAGERDGQKLAPEKLKTLKVTVKGDQFTIEDGRGPSTATIILDVSQKPGLIEFQRARDDKPALGIFEWSGDRLKVCWNRTGAARPNKFATGAENDGVVFELERSK